jgi:putative intracellular protease/amidase
MSVNHAPTHNEVVDVTEFSSGCPRVLMRRVEIVGGRPDLDGCPPTRPKSSRTSTAPPAIRGLDLASRDAIVVCGEQGPTFQFRDHEDLKEAIATFYEAHKPTRRTLPRHQRPARRHAVRRHIFIEGRTMSGFPTSRRTSATRLSDRRRCPSESNTRQGRVAPTTSKPGLFKAFAIRDMNLITGQQAYSGSRVARLVIESLGD